VDLSHPLRQAASTPGTTADGSVFLAADSLSPSGYSTWVMSSCRGFDVGTGAVHRSPGCRAGGCRHGLPGAGLHQHRKVPPPCWL